AAPGPARCAAALPEVHQGARLIRPHQYLYTNHAVHGGTTLPSRSSSHSRCKKNGPEGPLRYCTWKSSDQAHKPYVRVSTPKSSATSVRPMSFNHGGCSVLR